MCFFGGGGGCENLCFPNWETDSVLGGAALLTIQRQRCINFRVLRAQDFYTPLVLNCQKGQHLPALEVYENQSPTNALFS